MPDRLPARLRSGCASDQRCAVAVPVGSERRVGRGNTIKVWSIEAGGVRRSPNSCHSRSQGHAAGEEGLCRDPAMDAGGNFTLYGDEGDSYRYKKGAHATIPVDRMDKPLFLILRTLSNASLGFPITAHYVIFVESLPLILLFFGRDFQKYL